MAITMETAREIAFAHQEIRTAEGLLTQIEDAMGRGDVPNIRDAFGRPRGLQLGVPSGDNGHRLFDVPWTLARPIIETHIASQRAKIAILSAKAVTEAGGPIVADNVAPDGVISG